jgi:putative heme iron utilization protein
VIGGFGDIRWLAGDTVRRDPLGGGLGEAAPSIVAHMNADHEEALRAIVAAATGRLPARARIRSVDRAGFLVDTRSPDALRYVGYGREIEAAEAREVFVALAREARAKISG